MKHSRVTFNLDLGDIISDISIPIKKTAKVLNIILMENGQPYEIEPDCKVVFYAKKPNGDVLYNDCIVRDNVVEYQLTTQTIALAGIVECELLVYGEDSSTPIHSPSFTLVNYEPVFDGGEAIESTNEFTALTQAMGTLETLIDQAKDVVSSKSDDYIIHAPNYISSNTTPSDIKFGTHVCAITEFDSTLPESNKEYTVQGTLEVTKAFDSIDSVRMYWYPCRSHNVYSRLPITDQNWSEWETAESGGGVAESVVNEKIATAKRELIGGADDLTDADTIHAAKNLARGLVNGLENKVVMTTELNNAINSALLQAKESGKFDGADGLSTYEIWLQQGNTGSEADFLESLKGANGKDGADGINGVDGKNGTNGIDGEDGKDGTSVTITSVTESTADGGENVVTFSNGQTLKVKNGSKGSQGIQGEQGKQGIQGEKGEQGEKGDAYTLTEADKQEIAQNATSVCVAKNQGASNVGKILVVGTDGNLTLADMPEGGASGDVVGVLDESNNILLSGNLADGTYTLKYENADGTYTEVGTLEVGAIQPEIVNLADPTSADWVTGSRLSVSGQGLDSNGMTNTCIVTNYIPVSIGDVVSISGGSLNHTYGHFAGDIDKSKLLIAVKENGGDYWSYSENKFTVLHEDVKFMRFTIREVNDPTSVIITIS